MVPFHFSGPTPYPELRHLLVGAKRPSMPGWDTMDWGGAMTSTYDFDLLAPDWPISQDTYDEIIFYSGLSGMTAAEVSMVLRRTWRIMKAGGSLRARFSDSQSSRAEEFDTIRASLFKAGFMDIEDVSTAYMDTDLPSTGIVSAFKSSGMFGWTPR
jgi:hypothetical protein